MFQNYDLYIGDSSDYKLNTKCDGGPFQDFNNPKESQVNEYSGSDVISSVWPYGKEDWCNLEGRYLHIVANLNHLMDTYPYDEYAMSLCQIGVYGTKYVRKGEPVPVKVYVARGTVE